jgi:hypothetical protein
VWEKVRKIDREKSSIWEGHSEQVGGLNGGEGRGARQRDGEESRTDGKGVGSGEKLTAKVRVVGVGTEYPVKVCLDWRDLVKKRF